MQLNNPYLTASTLINLVDEIILPGEVKGRASFENLKKALTTHLVTKTASLSLYPELKEVIEIVINTKSLVNEIQKRELLDKLRTIKDWEAPQSADKLHEFNTIYGYFQDSPDLMKLFCQLTKKCRAMSLLFEPDAAKEDIFYEYAYRILVLFVDDVSINTSDAWLDKISKKVEALFKTNDSGSNLLQQVLITRLKSLPTATNVKDRQGWMRLVEGYGVQMLPYMHCAPEIEALRQKQYHGPTAPQTIDETIALYAQTVYKRGNEDVEFAVLCSNYNVSELRFDRGLNFLTLEPGWPKKFMDSLPDVMVTGNKTDRTQQFLWEKLEVNDKRSLILGNITWCCQTIGNYEQGSGNLVVIDGVNLIDRGFYVLKDKEKIIGQAYAWLSSTGNMCLDTVECLPRSIKPEQLKKILLDFTSAVLFKCPTIKRVTVGRGTKDIEGLFDLTHIPEMMHQGLCIKESEQQYCIAKRANRLTETQQKELDTLLVSKPLIFGECIKYFIEYISDTSSVITEIRALLEANPSLISELTPSSLNRLLFFNPHPTCDDLKPIDINTLNGISSDEKNDLLNNFIARLVWRENTPERILRVKAYVTEEIFFNLMMQRVNNNETILHLAKENPNLLEELLTALSPNQLVIALTAQDNEGDMLWNFAGEYPLLLKKILAKIPSEQLFQIATKAGFKGTLLHFLAKENFTLFEEILTNLSQSQLFRAIKKTDSYGHFHGWMILNYSIKSPDLLERLLKAIPSDQRFHYITQKSVYGFTMLNSVIKSPDSLERVLNAIAKKDFLQWLHHAIISPDSVGKLLGAMPAEQRVSVVIEKNDLGQTVMDQASIESLKVILMLIPINCFDLLIKVQESLFSNEGKFSILKEAINAAIGRMVCNNEQIKQLLPGITTYIEEVDTLDLLKSKLLELKQMNLKNQLSEMIDSELENQSISTHSRRI